MSLNRILKEKLPSLIRINEVLNEDNGLSPSIGKMGGRKFTFNDKKFSIKQLLKHTLLIAKTASKRDPSELELLSNIVHKFQKLDQACEKLYKSASCIQQFFTKIRRFFGNIGFDKEKIYADLLRKATKPSPVSSTGDTDFQEDPMNASKEDLNSSSLTSLDEIRTPPDGLSPMMPTPRRIPKPADFLKETPPVDASENKPLESPIDPTKEEIRSADHLYATNKFTDAFNAYKALSEKGVPEGYFGLGKCYFHGKHVKKNYGTAAQNYLQAATMGHPKAQFQLGKMHKQGLGVERDISIALDYLIASAENGDAEAQLLIAEIYLGDSEKIRDREKDALYYLTLAVSHEKPAPKALFLLGKYLLEKYNPSEDELIRAAEALEQASDNGDIQSKVKLAGLYFSGRGVKESREKAFKLYQSLPQHLDPDPQVQLHLGIIYLYGAKEIDQDYTKAIDNLRKAWQKGLAEAFYQYGEIYRLGLADRPENKPEAIEWYKKAVQSDSGHKLAQEQIDLLEKDTNKAEN